MGFRLEWRHQVWTTGRATEATLWSRRAGWNYQGPTVLSTTTVRRIPERLSLLHDKRHLVVLAYPVHSNETIEIKARDAFLEAIEIAIYFWTCERRNHGLSMRYTGSRCVCRHTKRCQTLMIVVDHRIHYVERKKLTLLCICRNSGTVSVRLN